MKISLDRNIGIQFVLLENTRDDLYCKECSQFLSSFRVGIHDLFDMSFVSEWTKLGHKVINKKHMGAARQYLKQGCPPGLRRHVWGTLFGVHVNDMDVLYHEQLKVSDEKA